MCTVSYYVAARVCHGKYPSYSFSSEKTSDSSVTTEVRARVCARARVVLKGQRPPSPSLEFVAPCCFNVVVTTFKVGDRGLTV